MDYQQVIKFLFNQLPMYQRDGAAAYKNDLSTSLLLDQYFNHPHKQFNSIHIAGTNGKGSCSHMLASVLQEAGYKTALYTSPHLHDFRERIKINGQMIPENDVISFVEDHSEVIKDLRPSFFEITVAMAFNYFAQEKADIAVLETGMGGRLDSTNLVNPILSIITNIGLDHTKFLGNTLTQISREKAGIIKPGVSVVIGETQEETKSIFLETTQRKNAEITFADQHLSIPYQMKMPDGYVCQSVMDDNDIKYKDLCIDLNGIYQKKNLVTVLSSLQKLQEKGLRISNEHIYNGLRSVVKNTGLLGRWQTLGNNPLIIADTGHNIEGMKLIVEQIKQTPYEKLHFVFGVVNDKNIDQIIPLLPQDAQYYFTKASIPRALNENILAEKARSVGLVGESYPTVAKAFQAAKNIATHNDLIFVGGSTFIVAEVV